MCESYRPLPPVRLRDERAPRRLRSVRSSLQTVGEVLEIDLQGSPVVLSCLAVDAPFADALIAGQLFQQRVIILDHLGADRPGTNPRHRARLPYVVVTSGKGAALWSSRIRLNP
jgi:hypothetical protein